MKKKKRSYVIKSLYISYSSKTTKIKLTLMRLNI